ncbi:pentapeptide repeat-containing protein [Actinomadura sp. GC306]|uniref:pentapeptide repeat-containing protein n=1 Tax=Actinomadura sp. GC306 TaxID=2530367 RepID=UPI00140541F6|nr:pentapeptide repeat-containing protein [Actinomadura sp. GC306]
MVLHESSPASLFWPRCTAVPGCTGRAAEPAGGCPAHLDPREFERFMDALRPGAEVDLRGVTVPSWLLEAVLDAVTGRDGRPHLGRTRFDGAVLPSDAALRGFCVEGDSSFDGACFLGVASFHDARFFGNASFRDVRFGRDASFEGARFHRHTSFEQTVFTGAAGFAEARWLVDASFRHAAFVGPAAFDHAAFGRDAAMEGTSFGGEAAFRRVRVARHARFERAKFRRGLRLGPLVAIGGISLADAVVHGGLHVHAAARRVTARGTTVYGDADFALRYADLDLAGAAFTGAASVRSLPEPIPGVMEPSWPPAGVRLTSVQRIDAPLLQVTGVDLGECALPRRPERRAGGRPPAPRRSWLRRATGRS